MYSWGEDTRAAWKGPGAFDYGSARAARTYVGDTSSSRGGGRGLPVLGRTLKSDSTAPLMLGIDVTGSMSSWPRTFFEKFPLLYEEVKRYYDDVEICFAAVGDATYDRVPIQAGDFAKDKVLDETLNSIYPEGGGGGGARESYELMAYYAVNKVDIPNAKKPLFIFAGDEGFYETLSASQVKTYVGGDIEGDIPAMEVMAQLQKKWDTYIIRKPYTGSQEDAIHQQWVSILGEKVIRLDDPRRIVDCIIGIIAASAGKTDDFVNRLTVRQKPDQVTAVMKSLRALPTMGDPKVARSMKALPPGSKSKKLG